MSKPVIAAVVLAIFLGSFIAGALQPDYLKESIKDSALEYFKPIQEIIEKRPDIYLHTLPIIILLNNLRVALLNFLLGVTVVVPIGVLLYNGFVVGAIMTHGDIIGNALLLLPHGIVELTAILYSAFLGLSLGAEALKKIRGKTADIVGELRKGANVFPYVILLLVIAAFIETFVTPIIYYSYLLLTGQQPPPGIEPYRSGLP